MSFQLDPTLFLAFFLGLARAAAWVLVTPPFNTRMVPAAVKAGFAAALALSVTGQVAPSLQTVRFDTASLVGALTVQVGAGLALGFIAQMLFASVSAAGSLVDLVGGFSISQAFDPFLKAQASIFGRLYQLLTVTLLFAMNGHIVLVRGFLTSFSAVPLKGPSLNRLGSVLSHDVGLFFVAAVEVAAPLLGALFLAQVVLGLLSRAAPSLNVFALSFPFTILVTIVLAGLALPLVPGAVSHLLGDTVRSWGAIIQ